MPRSDEGVAPGWRFRVLGSAVNAWVVPALVVLLLGGAIWFGLRWVRSEYLGALAATPLFSHLSRNRLMSILRSTKPVEFPPGAVIVREGEAGKGFYIITEGTASVSVAGLDRATLTSGAYFGEVSVIDGSPRSATITATTRVSTLELTSAALRSVLDREPDVAASIAEELRGWLARAGAPSTEAMTGPVDRATLEELCRELRKIEHPEWTQAEPPPRHRLRDVFAPS